MKKHSEAMIFGVFDGLHEGHRYFISEAASRCEQLIIVVTKDEIVAALKGRAPKHSYAQRSEAIRDFIREKGKKHAANSVIVPSDSNLGEWKVLRDRDPEMMIFLGHDQDGIARELEKLGRTAGKSFAFLGSYHPEKFKSSLLR